MKPKMKFLLDDFCSRQFDKTKAGLSFLDIEKQALVDFVQKQYDTDESVVLADGYAPFCKHLFVTNPTTSLPAFIEITDTNKHFLESAYNARRANELPVLERWFPFSALPEGSIPAASYLDIILYSREQCEAEAAATQMPDLNKGQDYDYGIISVKA